MIDAGEHTIGQELEYTPYQLQLMKALLGAFPEATFTLRNTMRWGLLNPAGAPDLPSYKNSTLYDAEYKCFDECEAAAAPSDPGIFRRIVHEPNRSRGLARRNDLRLIGRAKR